MKKRQVILSILFLLLIPLALIIRNNMGAENGDLGKAEPPALRMVQVITAEPGNHQIHREVSGRIQAKNRLGIFAEFPGRMVSGSKPFKSGVFYNKGELIFRLDSRVERKNLEAKVVQWMSRLRSILPDISITYPGSQTVLEEYLLSIQSDKPLPDFPKFTDPSLLAFISSRGIMDAYHQIKAEETRLSKYAIYAPFSGQLTDVVVLPGSYVQPGQKMAELTGTYNYELEVAVPLNFLSGMSKGSKVKFVDPNSSDEYQATLKRVIKKLDPRNQSATLIFELTGSNFVFRNAPQCSTASASIE